MISYELQFPPNSKLIFRTLFDFVRKTTSAKTQIELNKLHLGTSKLQSYLQIRSKFEFGWKAGRLFCGVRNRDHESPFKFRFDHSAWKIDDLHFLRK